MRSRSDPTRLPAIIYLALLVLYPGTSRAAQPLFPSPYLVFEAGNRQQNVQVSAGDLDLDGKPDLVAIGAQKSVLLNQGGGMFGSPLAFSSCAAGPAIIADLNHDGYPDLASVGGQGVCVSHGLGDGTFEPSDSYSTRFGAQSGALTDLNGDGWLDFLVTYRMEGSLSVLPGRPDGIFATTAESPVPAGSKHLALGDFNRDGHVDVAVTVAESSAVYVMLAGEGNTFAAGPKIPVGSQPVDLAVGDFDGDGNPDLATMSTAAGSITTLRGDGTGALLDRHDIAVGARPVSIVAADLNRDGRTDLAVANNTEATEFYGSISILMAGAGGAFSRSDLRMTPDSRSLTTGDFNGDRIPDLAVGLEYATDVAVLLGRGDGTFGSWNHVTVAQDGVGMVLADVNHDHRNDVVTANRIPGVLSVLLGHGDGAFTRVADVPLGDQPNGLASGDWDGDRNDDVAFLYSFGIATLRSTGNGSFTGRTNYSIGVGPQGIAAADVDGDGHPDLLVANPNHSSLTVLLGRGDGTFAPPRDNPVGSIPQGVLAVDDFNRDRKPDVALCRADYGNPGYISILLGNGDGTFGAPLNIPTSPGDMPEHIATGDLNSDGREDIVSANALGSTLTVLLGNGDGTFQRAPTISMYPMRGAEGVRIDDLDEDGVPDLAVGTGGSVRIRYGNGDGTFRIGEGYGIAQGGSEILLGSVNSDCKPDLVVLGRPSPSTQNSEVTVFLKRAGPVRPALAVIHGGPHALPIGSGPPAFCADLQPMGGSFDLADIVPESISMISQGTGSVSTIFGSVGKTAHVGDRHQDGIAELQVCFTREDLALLFSDVRDHRTVTVSIEGCLPHEERFAAPLTLELQGSGRAATAVSVSPNPLNPHGVLRYVTTRPGPVRVRAYDLGGRLVGTLAREPLVPAGTHELSIDADGAMMPSGVYFYRIETPDGVQQGRFTVLK